MYINAIFPIPMPILPNPNGCGYPTWARIVLFITALVQILGYVLILLIATGVTDKIGAKIREIYYNKQKKMCYGKKHKGR